MSLVYAKKSDEIGGCALHVFLHATIACSVWYRDLDVEEHQELCGYACTRVYLRT
jgi:hypothetical protein